MLGMRIKAIWKFLNGFPDLKHSLSRKQAKKETYEGSFDSMMNVVTPKYLKRSLAIFLGVQNHLSATDNHNCFH